MRFVVEQYPPSTYPKLYTRTLDECLAGQKRYFVINHVIGALGLLLVFSLASNMLTVGNPKLLTMLPCIYGMVQFVPLMYIEIKEMREYKLMREMNKSTIKKADLTPRSLFDYATPLTFLVAGTIAIVSIFMDFYWHNFDVSMGHDSVVRMITLLMCNALFMGIILWNVYGKKQNPYQANKDRFKFVQITVTTLLYLSIVMSLFFMVTAAGDVFDTESLEPLFMSIYFQLIAWISIGTRLKSMCVKDIDFDVYKSA